MNFDDIYDIYRVYLDFILCDVISLFFKFRGEKSKILLIILLLVKLLLSYDILR